MLNFVQTCLELIWNFWLHANDIFSWLSNLQYYKANSNYCKLSVHAIHAIHILYIEKT